MAPNVGQIVGRSPQPAQMAGTSFPKLSTFPQAACSLSCIKRAHREALFTHIQRPTNQALFWPIRVNTLEAVPEMVLLAQDISQRSD
jgi:hypothetical protein